MPHVSLVVPCYEEASRLDVAAFQQFATSGLAHLFLVNDGSKDNTLSVLREVQRAAPERVSVLDLERNGGKAEAVRRGMLAALETKTDYVGFWDADLATPFNALQSFVDVIESTPNLETVMGSRVRLLGRNIDRRAARHYSGRAFATAVSLTLRLPVYDTQCGAKLFRATPKLKDSLGTPFLSRWIFDVELLARLGTIASRYTPSHLCDSVYEYPLIEWRDVAGSKLKATDFAKSAVDLMRIYRAYIRPNRRS